MRIVVTGGAGFIGSHLIDRLLEQGHHVICVDNYFTGQRKNIKHLLENSSFELVDHDIVQPLYLENINQLYNLACPASPIHYQKNPIKTVKTSTSGMINMLGLAKKNNARILQASTSEVYGDPEIHPQPESYWGHVNPIGPRACYSNDTEVLTQEGWKRFQDITPHDKIATLNQNGFLEYQQPTELIKEQYQGELIQFQNSKIDLLVTPNHSMYVKRRDQDGYELRPAYDAIRWDRAEMKKDARWNGAEIGYFHLPAVSNSKFGNQEKIKMDDWLEFFGYYITEGCVHQRHRIRTVEETQYQTIDYNILIAQDPAKLQEREKIRKCLERLPFKFFESDDHQFRIVNKQLALYLAQFGKSHQKYLPTQLKNASKRQLKILFDAMMLGDGSKQGNAYYTNSPRLAGDFQEILLKLGMAGSTSAKDKRKPRHVYQIHILTNIKKDFLSPKYPKRSVQKYDGYVYCVSVPNRIIYVRRNGKALFCGNCYDEGKRVAETLCFDYHREHDLEIRVARIFNTYGPRMHAQDGRVVSNFIIQALQNQPITIYGDGSHTRSFCYVDDLVEGLIRLMNQNDSTGPVNLGNPTELTVKQLAEKIITLTKSKSKIVYKDLPQDDPKQRQPDISLAKKLLDWSPVMDLKTGLKKTIEYFRSL